MKVLLLSFFSLLFIVFGVHGQTGLSVERFTLLPNDMEARSLSPIRDANGDLTALIKVVTNEQGFDFDGGSLGIVKVMPQPGEIWVYVPDRARSITIRHGKFGVLRNYAYPVPVKSGNVYEMKLSHGTVEVIIKPREIPTEWLVISSTPAGADVYLNEQAVGKTPYSAELPEGRYTWRVERNLYQTEAGVAELSTGQRVALDLSLKPNFGRLDLSTRPDEGAKVLLNGIDVGKKTPCWWDELPAGEYTFTLSHEWFETTTYKAELKAGDELSVEVPMKPTFGELELAPTDDVRYYVNDKESAAGVLRLAPGVYNVEARKPAHSNARVQVVVEREKRQSPELKPQPLYGRLRLQSQPFGAALSLDGKEEGETPYTYREVLVGQHQVRFSKEGYAEEVRTVEVKDGETTDLTVELKPVENNDAQLSTADRAPFAPECEGLNVDEREQCTQRVIMRHIAENTRYPKLAQMAGIQGKVFVSFVINKEGSVVNAEAIKTVDDLLDAEAIRVVSSLPKFSPGVKDGKAVSVKYTIPVSFKLDGGDAPVNANTTNSSVNLRLLEEIVNAHYEACGGLRGFERITSYQEQSTIKMDTEGMTLGYSKLFKMPDKAKMTTSMTGFELVQILNGNQAVNITNGTSERQGEGQLEALKQSVNFTLMMDWLANPASVVFVGTRNFKGKTYQVIDVDNGEAGKTTYFFDPTTKMLAATEVKLNSNDVEVGVITYILSYTQVDGLKFPKTFEIDTGANRMTIEVSSIQLNQPISDAEFRIP